MQLNEISIADAEREIGSTAFKRLKDLEGFLGDSLEQTARVSQSIMTRSEVALFGLSIPRFAVRIPLKHSGFVNCRRLATLARMFHIDNSTEWGNRYRNEEIESAHRNTTLEQNENLPRAIADVLAQENCVADSLLRQPRRFVVHGFRNVRYVDVSQARLPQAYGESLKDAGNSAEANANMDPDFSGDPPLLPYTQTMNLGRGLCAQGASFIATAILSHYSKCVHGIAEITALAHEPECRELTLGGLDPERMERYFEQVNLGLAQQCLTSEPRAILLDGEKRDFAAAIRCYVNSGMPVILPTSPHKLAKNAAGYSIYEKNAIRIRKDAQVPNEDHVVVIVGWVQKGETFFVFHDTATMPFLVASAEELTAVGPTRGSSGLLSDNGMIMPVVPRQVKMPLLRKRISVRDENGEVATSEMKMGLITMTEIFHWQCEDPCRVTPRSWPDRFQLISHKGNVDLSFVQDENDKAVLEAGLLNAFETLEQKRSWQEPHWLWVERFPNSLWIWDAEVLPIGPLPRAELMREIQGKHLLAVVHLEQGGEITFYSN